jgi:hypothetical protein
MGLEQPIAIALDNSRIKQATRLASIRKQTIARKLPFTRSIARWLINDHFSKKYPMNQQARFSSSQHQRADC